MEQNIRITLPARDIRRMARAELKGHWQTAILAYILYFLLLFVPRVLIEFLFWGGFSQDTDAPAAVAAFAVYLAPHPAAQMMSSVYLLIIQGPLDLGLAVFMLAIARGKAHGPGMILDGFNNFFRAFGLFLLYGIFIFLWSLLFIVPGIIASLAYAQAFFLLADNPRIGLLHALKQSRRLMIGNKWKFVCLSLSFIGWIILSSFAAVVIVMLVSLPFVFSSPGPISAFGGVGTAALFLIALPAAMVIAVAPVSVYIATAGAIFYDLLTGRRRLIYNADGFFEARRPEAGADRDAGAEAWMSELRLGAGAGSEPSGDGIGAGAGSEPSGDGIGAGAGSEPSGDGIGAGAGSEPSGDGIAARRTEAGEPEAWRPETDAGGEQSEAGVCAGGEQSEAGTGPATGADETLRPKPGEEPAGGDAARQTDAGNEPVGGGETRRSETDAGGDR